MSEAKKRLVLIDESGQQIEARCGTCAHWKEGDCSRFKKAWIGASPPAGEVAWLWEEDGAWLGSTEDFGCALFQVRP